MAVSWCGGKIDEGIDFLVPCGTTGESPTLTRDEHLRVVAITVEESKQGGAQTCSGAGRSGRLLHAGGYRTRQRMRSAPEPMAFSP